MLNRRNHLADVHAVIVLTLAVRVNRVVRLTNIFLQSINGGEEFLHEE